MGADMWTVGIDPGKEGAAVLLCNGLWATVVDWTTGPETARNVRLLLELHPVALVALEKVHSMPRQGVASSFKFGASWGWWDGLLDALGARRIDVPPQTWMKGVVPAKASPADKPGLLVARRLWPDAPLKLAKHHNRADAGLIARWAWMQAKGGR